MSDNNNININTPEIGPYTRLQPFRFWCQKVLPLVYDESLSYYELLCKVVDYLNKTMEDVDQMITDMGDFQAAYTQFTTETRDAYIAFSREVSQAVEDLETFVNNYFLNLDVQQEINNKLDAMAENGYFVNLFNTLFTDDVQTAAANTTAAWIADNLLQETGYVIDNSLTVQNAAADAKAVGDRLNDFTDIVECEILHSWVSQRYIKTNVDPVDVNTEVVNSAYNYLKESCAPGDIFTITGTGADAARLWTFVDLSGNVLEQAEINEVGNDLLITAPTDSAYLIVNIKNASPYRAAKGYLLQAHINELDSKTNYSIDANLSGTYGYVRIDTGGIVSNPNWKYAIINTVPGEKIVYNAALNNVLAGICFYKADGTFISGVSAKTTDQLITTPQNAYIIKATFNCDSGGVILGYIKYGTDESVVSKLGEIATAYENTLQPKLILPTESIAVIGHEWNMYYENVIKGLSDEYYVLCRCTGDGLGRKAYKDCLRFTPTTGEAGNYTVIIELRAKRTDALIDSGRFTLKVIADSVLTGKKVIFIGDSLTDDGVYPAEIQYNLSSGGIVSVGTIHETITYGGNSYAVDHEGRGGWNTTNYIEDAVVSGVTNPFYNPVVQKFDFGYYMSQNGFTGINVVSIYLGTNADSSFDVTIQNLHDMIDSIHDYDSDIIVLINTFHEPAGQNGCGNHNGLQCSQALRNSHLIRNEKIMKEFYGETNVEVSTLYFNVDGEHDYPTVTQPLSSRNPETIVRQNNNVHPSVYGYLKFADSIYNQLLDILS